MSITNNFPSGQNIQIDSALSSTSTNPVQNNVINSALSSKANTSDVLTKTNTTSFTPTANYHPATKAYVDSKAGGKATRTVYTTVGTQSITVVSGDIYYGIVVGGGGGGGFYDSSYGGTGGAGGGGAVLSGFFVPTSNTLSITVGAGGKYTTTSLANGGRGGTSKIGSFLTAYGGYGGSGARGDDDPAGEGGGFAETDANTTVRTSNVCFSEMGGKGNNDTGNVGGGSYSDGTYTYGQGGIGGGGDYASYGDYAPCHGKQGCVIIYHFA